MDSATAVQVPNRKRFRTEDLHENACEEINMITNQPYNANSNGLNNHANFLKPCCSSRRFLPVAASEHVFQSEDCKPKGETLYVPLRDDTLLNLQNIEQITVTKGSFFLGDETSRFNRTAEGAALNLWRYDQQLRRLFISRSFVFTSVQAFEEVKQLLDFMWVYHNFSPKLLYMYKAYSIWFQCLKDNAATVNCIMIIMQK